MDGAIACFQETAEGLTSSSQDYDNLDSESESDIKNQLSSLLGALDKIQNLQRSGSSSSNGGQRRSSNVSENNRRNADDGNSNNNGGNDGDGDGDGFIRTSMRYNNKQKKVSFRTLLNNSNLAFELSELMSHRIQYDLDESCHHNANGDENDENVNTSANGNNSSRNKTPSSEGSKTNRRRSSIGGDNNHSNTSWTVSTIALMAGRIFVELSAMSGAWGAGWIDVGVMKNLEALVRRWGDESRGKKLISSHGSGSGIDSDASNLSNASFADGKRKRLSQGARKRARNILEDGDGDGDDERRANYSQDDYSYRKQKPQRDSGASFVDKCNGLGKDSDHTVPGSIMLHGLQLAESLGSTINNNDYVNWSKDARDAILEASIIAWRVSCAFTANKSFTHSNGKGLKGSLAYIRDEGLYCSMVCEKLNSALEQCIVSKAASVHSFSHRDADEDTELMATSITSKSSSSKSSREEAVIAFLRGVLPLLTYQVDLPNGVKGKSAGFNSASSLTVKILGRLSKKIRVSSFATTPAPSGKKHRSAGPSKTPRANAPSSSRKTPRSHRKGLDGRLIVPPSLKKTITPKLRRRRSLMEQNQSETLAQSRTALDIFLSLMQKMSTSKGMEKGEVRIRISAFLKNCMVELPDAHRVAFLRFVVQLCRSKVSAHRIFAVELIGNFLCMEWLVKTLPVAATDYDDIGASASKSTATSEFPTTDTSGILSDDKNIASSMLCALHGRINDRAPAVRVRALSALSNALGEINSGSDSSTLSQCIENFRLPLLSTLRKRVSIDDKATARRASITALVNLLLFSNDTEAPHHFSEADAGALCQMCSDSSVGVRKAAIDAILKLIENQNENDLENGQKQREMLEAAWADAVLPLIYDIEMTCAARVVESFSFLVIKPMLENSDVCDSSWRILSRIHAASSSAGAFKGGKNAISFALKKYLESCDVQQQQRQCMQLLKILHQNIIRQLDESGGIKSFSEQFTGSWCFLEAFTSLHSNKIQRTGITHFRKEIEQSSIGTDFLVRCWNAIARIGDSRPSIVKNKTKIVATKKSCLGVISGFSSLMTEGEARNLSDSLFNQMADFSTSIDIIGSSVSALVRITQRLFKEESVKKACEEWMIKLLEKCQNQMAQFISNEQLTSSRLDRVLFTAGELLMIGFHPSEDLSVAKGAGLESNDTIRGLYFKPPKRTVQLIQSFLLPTLPGLEEQRKIPSKIRAHAFAAFGKLCLRDECLAKESINIFARELHQEGLESDPAVKSNALLVLGDFCIRYTHLVDKFLPLMASCLQHQQNEKRLQSPSQGSSESIVRHHAIMILSNLIMKDYIKWKGILFYRFLAATMDDDPSVSNVAKLFLCGPLLSKQPTLFFHNFVDTLFVLNGCTAHPMFTSRNNRNSSMFQADGLSFSIDDCKTREGIYSLLLDHMSPEEKIGITARLSKEVLSAATELTGDLALAARSSGAREAKNGAFAVLSDCFQILTSTKMFIGRSPNSTDDSDLTSGGTSVSMSQNSTVPHLVSAKGKLLSKISRKQLVEAVIPILCTLKVTLENNRSPLLKNLMQYMLCIFSQFKKEVNETLASDQTLLQEIKYDMKRHSQGVDDCEGAAIRVM